MADEAVQKLRDAFADAPEGPVILNEAFWTDAGLQAPADFTAIIKAAFRVDADAEGLTIAYERGDVTPVDGNNRFEIGAVKLGFLNAPEATLDVVLFGQPGTVETPVLTIRVIPAGWQLADYFPYMSPKNIPFTLLAIEQQSFFYASAPISVTDPANGAPLALATGQNLYGVLTVPLVAQPLFALIQGLDSVPPTLEICGPITLDKATNDDSGNILYPDMDLKAPIPTGGGLSLLGVIDVSDPYLGLRIATVMEPVVEGDEEEGDELAAVSLRDGEDPVEEPVQTPLFLLGTTIALNGVDATQLVFLLEANVATDLTTYSFSVGPGDDTHPITPAAIVGLMAGQSYFRYVPPVLQQYLAAVQMQGFFIAGPMKPAPAVSQLSAALGSTGEPIVLFGDPTSGQDFTINSFSLNWTLNQPFATPRGQVWVGFEAEFQIFPSIFKNKAGDGPGVFTISIDNSLDFEGAFQGTASLDDVLRTITAGAIGMPDGVEVSFSDIFIKASPSRKAYSLGFEVDASVDVPFVTYHDPVTGDPRPLIEIVGLVFDLNASTPNRTDGQKGKSVYSGSMDGQILVGPVTANVRVDYDGADDTPVWTLHADLAEPVDLSVLIDEFFRAYDLPEFLPGTLSIDELVVDATIPTKAKAARAVSGSAMDGPGLHSARRALSHHRGNGWRSPITPVHDRHLPLQLRTAVARKPSYSVSTKIRWAFELTPDIPIDILADLAIAYEGNAKVGQEFSGSVIGSIDFNELSLGNFQLGVIQIGYRFGPETDVNGNPIVRLPPNTPPGTPAATTSSTTLWMSWKGVRAAYTKTPTRQYVTFSLKGWTVGSLITALVEMIDDPYFTLPSPWDILNSISLDSFSLTIDLTTGVKNRVSANYTLPSPINLGFLTIKALVFKQVDGKVTIAIDGTITVPGLQSTPLFNTAGEGQDVRNMPPVPGQGNAYFDLQLLALGQRIAISGYDSFKTTQEVILTLEGKRPGQTSPIPSSTGKTLPINPKSTTKGQPYYNRSANWLAAVHFGLLKIPAGTPAPYAIDFMVVFNDPNLYGLRLALNGDKMKVLAGLAIDVLYKKITDDVGCYQIEFTLPSVLRNLDFGAFKITLPVIGLQIYTNGDFLIDFGFPYNMDFSRSFTVEAIIYGVPVLGSGGFYFGKLSNATAPNLPKTTKGTFHPVIVFGIGLQLGLGRSIEAGILKAGFSITVFGIIEGTFAAWHPYLPGNRGDTSVVQGDYYFKLAGTFGIIGKLYGSIDFAIIKADVNLTVMVYVQITYESYRKIPLALTASVQVSVSVKIDLWLFSITINLSFSARITETLTIGSDSHAPWDADQAMLTARSHTVGFRPLPLARTLGEHGIFGRPLRLDFDKPLQRVRLGALKAATKATLEVTAATQFTVLAREGAPAHGQEGGLVLLITMDAPTADGATADPGAETSFGKLCAPLLPWLIASVTPQPDFVVPLLPTPGNVTRMMLEGILRALSDPSVAPFTARQIVDFLATHFTIEVTPASAQLADARKRALAAGATLFPAPDFLSLTVPDANAATGDTTIALDAYATATPAYQAELRAIFNSVAAEVASETGKAPPALRANAETPESLAATVFTDYFVLLSRQLVQAAMDRFDSFPITLDAGSSIAGILGWVNGLLPDPARPQLTPEALLAANLHHPLTPNLRLALGNFPYVVQTGDSLDRIAARYVVGADVTAVASKLALDNQTQTNLIRAGVEIAFTYDSKPYKTTTIVGDSFATIAARLGLNVDVVAAQPDVLASTQLLASGIALTIAGLPYRTADGDTPDSVMKALAIPASVFLNPQVMALANLFKPDPALLFALPGLVVLPEDALWPAIVKTGSIGQMAGTVARYMLHGMRLPVAPGLSLPSNFLYGPPHWPTAQSGYGLYQLTGQQFPLAERTDAYPVKLSRPDTVDYSWFLLNGGASLSFDIIDQTKLLTQVVTEACKGPYTPAIPSLQPEPALTVAPKRYGVATYVPWSTSDVSGLVALTRPQSLASAARAATSGAPQPKPFLFGLSSALLSEVEGRQAMLGTVLTSVKEMQPYLPLAIPTVGVTDPATSLTHFTETEDYCFATRIDFRIKHLAQDADLAPERPDANAIVPPGPGNAGSPAIAYAPFAYEVIGPNPGEAVLLERLLTAMDSEGESLLSGLFLLYGDVNTGTKGLTSRGASEFLAYLVQSNLSTETNPPPAARRLALAATPTPSGIANAPAEFIKLLWELSTVNSGGTYLYYQSLADNTGLPTALFDTSGVATITLVATIRRTRAQGAGERLFNAVNALVTTAPIDPENSVVDLTSVSAPTPSLDLARSGTSPQAIADFYGIDLLGLARANPTTALRKGAQLTLSGLYRQLAPGDVGPAKDPIAALAAYYSVGATQPITKEAILAFNPGVSVAALAVFRIPELTYVVIDVTPGPGTTLTSIAAYYATPAAAVIYGGRTQANFFAGSTVTIDPVRYAASPNLGLGNAGIVLTRERGQTPSTKPGEEQLPAYTRETMLQLYQLLSAGIAPNAFFKASPDGASFGPKDPPSGNDIPAGSKALRQGLSRVAAEAPYHYNQTLGYRGSALVNAAPAATNGLPAPAGNPYAGIGTILQVRLAWQDLFGNRTVDPFSTPEPGDLPPFGDVPVPLLYCDTLVPLDRWPSTTASYLFSGAPGAPQAEVTFAFDPTPYEPASRTAHAHLDRIRAGAERPVWQETAAVDLATFTTIYYQLNETYDGLGVPGLSGPAVTMAWVNSLLKTPAASLSAGDRGKVLAYVAAAVTYLTARAAGQAAPAPAALNVTLPIALGEIVADEDIIRLDFAFRLSRTPSLVAPDLRAIDGGISVTTTIQADGNLRPAAAGAVADEGERYPVALTKFAESFEKVFVTPDWTLVIGTSSSDPSTPMKTRVSTVWAVRMAVAASPSKKGIGYAIGSGIGYFAPLPIASSLQTLNVTLAPYQTGVPFHLPPPGTNVTLTSVDPNVWLSEALTAVDDILTATYATPMFLMDKLLGLDDSIRRTPQGRLATGNPGYLARILEHKKVLAEAIASTATPVLGNTPGGLAEAAKEKLKQALLNRLSTANSLTCVAVLPVTDAHYGPALKPGVIAAPNLYGQPLGTLAEQTTALTNDNFTLSSGKIPLNPQANQATSTLAFLVSSRSAETSAYVELDLAYALSHLEHDIRAVPGIANYRQSRWITFLTEPATRPITPASGSSFAIPVALRSLPLPATVVAQTGEGTLGDQLATSPADLKSWNYGFSYLLKQAAQDSVQATVVFNQPTGSRRLKSMATTAEALYAALAQFVAIYPAVARDLESALRPLSVKATDTLETAHIAVDAFEQTIAQVASTYDAWAKAQLKAALFAEAQPPVRFIFEIVLEEILYGPDAVPVAAIEILPKSFTINGEATDNFLPPALVEIDPEHYTPEIIERDAKTGHVKMIYARRADADPTLPAYLSYATARLDSARGVRFNGLDLFALQNGWASVQVLRNRHLSPDPAVATNPVFEFATAEARFADPLVPLIRVPSYALATAQDPAAPVAKWLGGFFTPLLTPAAGVPFAEPVRVMTETTYRYQVTPGVAGAGLPATVTPISLLPPTDTLGSPQPPFVDEVAKVAQDWFNANAFVKAPPAALSFDVTIFSAVGGSNLPLLSIGSVTVPATKIE